MRKLLLVLCLSCSLVTANAATVRFNDLQDDPKHSRMIERDGQTVILMPDGRVLSLGQGVLCTDECVTPAITPERSSRRWLIPVVLGAALIAVCVIACRGCRDTPPIVSPPTALVPPMIQPPTQPPITPVPEPSTLLLFAAGLLLSFSLRLLRK